MYKYPMLLLEAKQARFYPAEGGEVMIVPVDQDVFMPRGIGLISELRGVAPDFAAQLGFTAQTPDGPLLIGENFLEQPSFTVRRELVGIQVFVDPGRVTLSGVMMTYGFAQHGPFAGRSALRVSAYADGRVLARCNANIRPRTSRRIKSSSSPVNIANGRMGTEVECTLNSFLSNSPQKVREFFIRALEQRGGLDFEQEQLRALPDRVLWTSGLLALRNPGLLSLPLSAPLPRELGRVLSQTRGLKATRRVLCGEGLPRSLTAALQSRPMALALVLAWRWRGSTLIQHPRRKLPRSLHTVPGALFALLGALPAGRGELDWSTVESLGSALAGLLEVLGEASTVRLLLRSADDLSTFEEGVRVICDVQRMVEVLLQNGVALPEGRTLGGLHDALIANREHFAMSSQVLPLHSPLPDPLQNALRRLEGTGKEGDLEPKYLAIGNSSLQFKRVSRYGDLKAIGRDMNHCVDSYWGAVVRETSHILVGRNALGEPELCLEFDGQLKILRQCKGHRNARPDSDASNALRAWLEQAGVQIKTLDIAEAPLEQLRAA